jgi:hypothetical protein
MKDYVLYIKKCPGVISPRHFKIGVAALEHNRSRLATYQNAVGPVWQESFMHVWLGDMNHIKEAEKKFKLFFKEKIQSAEAGLSEWICDFDIAELLNFIDELRNDYYIKFIDAPADYLPLTMPLCEELAEWYEQNKPSEDTDS